MSPKISTGVPAVSSSPILSPVDDSDPLLRELADVPIAPDGFLELIGQMSDPRRARGKRHGLDGCSPAPARLSRSLNGLPTWHRQCWCTLVQGLGKVV